MLGENVHVDVYHSERVKEAFKLKEHKCVFLRSCVVSSIHFLHMGVTCCPLSGTLCAVFHSE